MSKRIWRGLLVAAGSLVLAAPAFAGVSFSTARLDGRFVFEDANEGDDNEACIVASGGFFGIEGTANDSTETCSVAIAYFTDLVHKASGSRLKSDDSGSAKVSQQVETEVCVGISGIGCPTIDECTITEKCKVSGSVTATEPSEVVDKAKASLNCDLNQDGAFLSGAQIDTIQEAFADRNDVKIKDDGKLTIKTKGVANTGAHFCAIPEL